MLRRRDEFVVGHDLPMTSAAASPITDLFRLDGKVAVVTGASSGLGVAFAQGLAEAGADVALGARRVERLADTAALVEAAGRKALSVATDVADPESCQALVDAAMEAFGRSTSWSTTPASAPPYPPPGRRPSSSGPSSTSTSTGVTGWRSPAAA